MKIIRTILAGSLFLLLSTQRSPAPIEEETPSPSPTPTPAQSASPSATAVSPLSRQEAARFAGTWTGKIKFGRFGDVDFTLVINPEATSLIQKSRFGELAHPTSIKAGALLWGAGEKSDHAWTLTPNPNGQTALTTLTLPSGVVSTAIFQRVQSQPRRSSPSPRSKSRQ
jgi:hypothetical protein